MTKKSVVLAMLLAVAVGLLREAQSATNPMPLQLQMRVPFGPTSFPSVVAARDGLPDNVPGHNEDFHPAVPITVDTVAGNTITLDLGGGQFAYYCHLQPGSVRVKAGQRVRRGQVIALIGGSGDAREPHLHFEITNSPKFLAGEGLPYQIDHFRVRSENDWESRTRELPLKDMVVDFGR